MKVPPPNLHQSLENQKRMMQPPLQKMAELETQDEPETFIDELTQLNNHKAFNINLEREWRRCCREQYPISLLRIDIDNFQTFHNTHGPLAGKLLLKYVAAELMFCLNRPGNFVARLGKGKFAVLLPNTLQASAQKIGRRILGLVRQVPYLPTKGRQHASVSIGVMTVAPGRSISGKPSRHLVEVANYALYWAKQQGQDRLVTATAASRRKRRRKRHRVDGLAAILSRRDTCLPELFHFWTNRLKRFLFVWNAFQ